MNTIVLVRLNILSEQMLLHLAIRRAQPFLVEDFQVFLCQVLYLLTCQFKWDFNLCSISLVQLSIVEATCEVISSGSIHMQFS
jgi:hypothetical protein